MNTPGAAVQRGAGRNVDDLAGFLLAHGRQHRATAKEKAFEIDRHHSVPLGRIDGIDTAAVHGNGCEDRRVVDQNIDLAETIESELDHLLRRGSLATSTFTDNDCASV